MHIPTYHKHGSKSLGAFAPGIPPNGPPNQNLSMIQERILEINGHNMKQLYGPLGAPLKWINK